MPGEESHRSTPAEMTIESAIKSLTDPGSFHKGKQGDLFLRKVKSNVRREKIQEDDRNQQFCENYDDLDDEYLLWYAMLARMPVLAKHEIFVLDVTSLIHALHAHPGVALTPAVIR